MNYRVKCLAIALLLPVFSFALAACGRDADKEKPVAPPAKPEVSAAKPGAVARRPSLPQPPPKILPVSGKILEILDTGSFIFVLVDWQDKKVWATVPSVELKVGEVISLDHATMIKGFHSKTLNRTFDELIFASSVVGKSPRPRVVSKGNPNDPRNRRSGKLMSGLAPAPAPASPVPPVAKPSAKANQ
ncbi:MAG: hypothetical protein HGA96_02605 [Desulfobulbaceae bacterium]|nr:hypothetical protein [Desulfobulbaceae bacterium]